MSGRAHYGAHRGGVGCRPFLTSAVALAAALPPRALGLCPLPLCEAQPQAAAIRSTPSLLLTEPRHLQLTRVEHALAELGDRTVLAVLGDMLQVVGKEKDVVVAARRRANMSDNIRMHEPEQICLRRPALVLLDDLDHLLVICETEIRRGCLVNRIWREISESCGKISASGPCRLRGVV